MTSLAVEIRDFHHQTSIHNEIRRRKSTKSCRSKTNRNSRSQENEGVYCTVESSRKINYHKRASDISRHSHSSLHGPAGWVFYWACPGLDWTGVYHHALHRVSHAGFGCCHGERLFLVEEMRVSRRCPFHEVVVLTMGYLVDLHKEEGKRES